MKGLQKPALYVYINGLYYHVNGVTQDRFQAIQSARHNCTKNMPQFACKTNVRTIAAECLSCLGNIAKASRLFGNNKQGFVGQCI